MNIYAYDFECYSKINWFCVTFININNQADETVIVNDVDKLKTFYNFHKDDIVVGYNSRRYDSILYKGILAGIPCGYLSEQAMKGKNAHEILQKKKSIQLYDFDALVKDKSLKTLELFMGDDIRETQVDFNINRPLTQKEIEQTLYYNRHDVIELIKVIKLTYDELQGHLDIISLYNLDMSNISKTKVQLASTALNVVKQPTLDDEFDIKVPDNIEIKDKYKFIVDWYLNPKNWSYKNYLHSNDNQHNRQLNCIIAGIKHVFGFGGVHGCSDKHIIDCKKIGGFLLDADVSAMYPTLDIVYGLLSRKFKNPDDFKQMRDLRLEFKAKKDSRSDSLKPMINGTYGASKDKKGAMYDPLMANLTCIYGQMIILDVLCHIEDYCEIIQSNTDGIFFWVKDEETKNKVISIIDECGKRLFVNFEYDEYTKMIQKDVNNYIAVKSDGKIKCKGAMVKYNTPIDNNCSILNDAVREYFINDTPVEDTINNCNELIKFQTLVKLSSNYKEVIYGTINDEKNMENGATLDGKVHRVFASTKEEHGGIYKVKIENGVKSYEKYANTSTHLFIHNDSVIGVECPDYLDKQYYIDEANKRIKLFLEDEVENTETKDLFNILGDNLTSYVNFLISVKEKFNSIKILDKYISANCLKMFGNLNKLKLFNELFIKLYDKKQLRIITVDKLTKDFNLPHLKNIIENNSILKNKTYVEFNYIEALKDIFNIIPNDYNINFINVAKAQISLFNDINYTDTRVKDNIYYVLNIRDVIKPNAILYRVCDGTFIYAKVRPTTYSILRLFDGDVIEIKNSTYINGVKVVGKDEKGINIIEEDESKKHFYVETYNIIYREPKNNYIESEDL